MEFRIKYAAEDCAAAFGTVYSQSYQAAFKGIIPDDFLLDVFSAEKRAEGLLRELSMETPINAIMYKDDEPIGIFTYGTPKEDIIEENLIEIWRIYIIPPYWGSKAAKELMSWGIREIQNLGYKKISLWVIEENLRARRFYEKMGFVHDGKSRIINVGKEIKDLRYIKHIQ